MKLSNVISHNVVKKCISSNNKMWMRANQCMLLILQIKPNRFKASSFFFGGGGAVFVFGVWFLGIFGCALCCYTNNFGEVKPSQVVAIFCWLC